VYNSDNYTPEQNAIIERVKITLTEYSPIIMSDYIIDCVGSVTIKETGEYMVLSLEFSNGDSILLVDDIIHDEDGRVLVAPTFEVCILQRGM